MWVQKEKRLPVKIWASTIDEGTKEQVNHLADLPFAEKHIALMPDAHSGYGMPIGGVLATKNVIVINAVGVDTGCGVQVMKLPIKNLSKEIITEILSEAKKEIPVGFNRYKEPQELPIELLNLKGVIWNQQKEAIKYQFASLGSGNHFLEIQQDSDGFVYLMVHSGSRQLGKKISDYYGGIAKELNEKYYSSIPSSWDLAFLPLDNQNAKDYLEDMNNAIDFAFCNRRAMLDKVLKIARRVVRMEKLEPEFRIDTRHNYAAFENHFGQNVIVHRKGAIRVREKELAVIPGSMGTASYIVRGKGNPESFMSASHGAGRRFSRTQANATITEEKAKKSMGNVIYMIEGNDRSEFPDAYKDIEEVMSNQRDLVETITKLKPIGVLKG